MDSVNLGIVLKREELVQHVRDAAYVMARSASAKSDAPDLDKHWLIDIFQDTRNGAGNDELATRAMNLAFSEVEHKLREWSDETGSQAMTDAYKAPTTYSLQLNVPSEMKGGSMRHLRNLVHEFIVDEVLLQWCILIGEDITNLAALASKVEDSIKEILNEADDCRFRPYFPF